ncbi:aldo/keto reductase [Candidatus Woesearchaeota archaeon]|nr:aldo/keto reductase [Candidatus Woesearchaeota archaeon]
MIGYGTYRLGEKLVRSDSENVELIRFAIDSGYKIIDTAESYLNGYSERLIGKAIKVFDRKELIIISKVSPNHLDFKNVIKSAVESVKRLGTYIDYYLIHVPNPNVSLNETFKAMRVLQEKKIIRFFGVSNFSIELLKESYKYGISAVQEEFSMAYPYNEEQLKFCKEHNILYFAYMPLSNGDLVSKENISHLTPYARKYNTTESNIALKWVVQNGAIPIFGSQNKKHILENAKLNFKLTSEEIKNLRSINWITH